MQRSLFLALIVREWRLHPWRHGVALLAVALGVALAFSVHLINNSALSEFSAAVRAANGEPDLTLRGPSGGFDDAVFERVAADPGVRIASPVLEIDTYAAARGGQRVAVRVLGIDALLAAPLAPALEPGLQIDVELADCANSFPPSEDIRFYLFVADTLAEDTGSLVDATLTGPDGDVYRVRDTGRIPDADPDGVTTFFIPA